MTVPDRASELPSPVRVLLPSGATVEAQAVGLPSPRVNVATESPPLGGVRPGAGRPRKYSDNASRHRAFRARHRTPWKPILRALRRHEKRLQAKGILVKGQEQSRGTSSVTGGDLRTNGDAAQLT
jgi:hypothetical protein